MSLDADEVPGVDPLEFVRDLRQRRRPLGKQVRGAIVEQPVGGDVDPHHGAVESGLEVGQLELCHR